MIKPIKYRILEYDDGKFNCQTSTPRQDWQTKSVQYNLEDAMAWINNHKEPKVPQIVKVYEIE